MQPKIGFGLIGTGAVSDHYVKAIQELQDAELVAVCSSTKERRARAERKFGVPAFNNYQDLVSRTDIQIVCILTESGRHLEPALISAEFGKHILCEKPLEVTLERADKMIRACREANVKLGCIFQNRFKPGYLLLKKCIEKGELGKLLFGNAYIKWFRSSEYYKDSHWRGTLEGDGGGALINQGIHTVDLLIHILGEPTEVTGKTGRLVHNIAGEDIALAIIRFKNGAFGTIEASTGLTPGYPERLEIYGEKGSVILVGGEIHNWNIGGGKAKSTVKKITGLSGSSDPMAISYKWHKIQIDDMIKSVTQDREPAVNGEEGKKALALVRAVYESANSGQPVIL